MNETQTRSTFGILMVILGGAQAVFFSLFTGIFGINSIYEDRRQGTLQRLLATPTRPSAVLAGKLLGNLAVVVAQLLLLLLALTTITSLIERQWDFMWGDNPFVLLLVVIALGMFASSLGVLIVGLARSPEQVQLAGPLISILLGGLGGSFGFMPPRAFAQLSPVWWGLDALRTLSGGEANVVLHLLVLFIAAIVFASLGSFFFRRRLGF